jgi:hypothetical protein
MDNVVELPLAEREELEEMRKSLLKVDSDRDVMARVVFLAERIADIIGEIDEISGADRQSLLWHLSLIRELTADQREQKLTPLCSLPRFNRDHPPDGAA